MPIVVIAYENVQPLFADTEEKLLELRKRFLAGEKSIVALAKHPVFPEQADYLPSGFFQVSGMDLRTDFGPYGNWMNFLGLLCKLFHDKDLQAFVKEPEEAKAFTELLSFDVRGQHYAMGPVTCAKLAEDFHVGHGVAARLGASFQNQYEALQRCFNTAKRNGAVTFNGP